MHKYIYLFAERFMKYTETSGPFRKNNNKLSSNAFRGRFFNELRLAMDLARKSVLSKEVILNVLSRCLRGGIRGFLWVFRVYFMYIYQVSMIFG